MKKSRTGKFRIPLRAWFESTKPFFFFYLKKRGIFELSFSISTFCLEIMVETIFMEKKEQTYGPVFLECVLTKALQRESFSQQ